MELLNGNFGREFFFFFQTLFSREIYIFLDLEWREVVRSTLCNGRSIIICIF